MLTEHYGVNISDAALYRMMNHIDDKLIEKIQTNAYRVAKSLFNKPIHVMFYDCTTLYFESFTEDELKENGFSKDLKFNQPQVLLSLLVTSQGLLVGYDVFPSATYEDHTMITAAEKLKKTYGLKELIIVADSGMLNEENLKLMEAHGKSYIVGGRIKNQSKQVIEHVLDTASYTHLTDGLSVKNIIIPVRKNKKTDAKKETKEATPSHHNP